MDDRRFSLEDRVLPVVDPATGAAGAGTVLLELLMIESRVVCTGTFAGLDLGDDWCCCSWGECAAGTLGRITRD